jgi:hypothetical protein
MRHAFGYVKDTGDEISGGFAVTPSGVRSRCCLLTPEGVTLNSLPASKLHISNVQRHKTDFLYTLDAENLCSTNFSNVIMRGLLAVIVKTQTMTG